jgi:hypothetical protein
MAKKQTFRYAQAAFQSSTWEVTCGKVALLARQLLLPTGKSLEATAACLLLLLLLMYL